MGIIQEFKAFAMRGNVIDLAVGVVIGGAFQKIVTSLVNDIITPPLNLMTAKSGVDFKSSAFKAMMDMPVKDAAGKVIMEEGKAKTALSEVVIFNYGSFLQNIVDFVIVAFSIFMAVKLINALKKKQEEAPAPAPAAPAEDVVLLREIRDALAKSAPRRVD